MSVIMHLYAVDREALVSKGGHQPKTPSTLYHFKFSGP